MWETQDGLSSTAGGRGRKAHNDEVYVLAIGILALVVLSCITLHVCQFAHYWRTPQIALSSGGGSMWCSMWGDQCVYVYVVRVVVI